METALIIFGGLIALLVVVITIRVIFGYKDNRKFLEWGMYAMVLFLVAVITYYALNQPWLYK